MDSPIEPTVGRVVLFRDSGHTTCALITRVWDNNCVNLMVMHDGQGAAPVTSVSYSEDENSTRTWHWMEYQRKVANV